MTNYVSRGGLSIAAELSQFVNDELLAGTGITPDQFWDGFDSAVHALAPRNRELLAIRDDMQQKIDSWLRDNASSQLDSESYTAFLRDIGYLVEEGPSFQIDTQNVDPEIASIAGPQLVVPITNARYALNAANARYGSLYDAFYGTDAIPSDGESGGKGYDPVRGAKVIARVRSFLDETLPLTSASWNDISGLQRGERTP